MSPMRSFQATVAAVCLALSLHCPGSDSFPTANTGYFAIRPQRHADALFHNNYKKLLGQLSARRFFESLLQQDKRIGEEQLPIEETSASPLFKRHSDALFTDLFRRLRKQQAAEKFAHTMLSKRRMMTSSEGGDSLVPYGDLDVPGFGDDYDPGILRSIAQRIAEVRRRDAATAHSPLARFDFDQPPQRIDKGVQLCAGAFGGFRNDCAPYIITTTTTITTAAAATTATVTTTTTTTNVASDIRRVHASYTAVLHS